MISIEVDCVNRDGDVIMDVNQIEENKTGACKSVHRRLVALFALFALVVGVIGITQTGILDLLQTRKLATLPREDELQQAVFLIDTGASQGTGFNVDKGGLVVTNFHVVRNSTIIEVATPKGDIYEGTVVNSNEVWDVAVIKITARNLPVVTLAKKEPWSGEKAIVIGTDPGSPQVIVRDIVRGKVWITGYPKPVMFLHGTVSSGDSGSPVFNQKGNVVGMVFANLTNGKNDKSILCIPVSEISKTLKGFNQH